MKRASLYLLASLLLCFTLARGVPGEADWKKVEQLVEKKQPKSALEALAPLEAAALAEKAWPEALRAIAMRIQIESGLEADKPEAKIIAVDAALAKAPAEMQPMLQALAADWYGDYFRQNRWRIMRRTAGGAGGDAAAWDLKRFLTEIDARFQKALNNTAALQQTPIAAWQGLLSAGGLPDSYQPTLYDFIARQALVFYTAPEQAGSVEEGTFESADTSPALGTMEEFLAWQPGQGNAPKLQAIRLFQAVLNFHAKDGDPGARVLLDIERLEWAAQTATGSGTEERAAQQFSALAQKHSAHEISLRAKSVVADNLIKARKPADARKLLQDAVAAFGKSVFAPRCRNQIKEIERREFDAGTELVWNAAQPEIVMTYRNVRKVFFRLYLISEKPNVQEIMREWDADEDEMQAKMKKKFAREWSVDLPPADDFMEHRFRQPAPVDLKPGIYYLVASGNESFDEKENMLAVSRVWVTSLALVTRQRSAANAAALEAWAVDAVSGEPLKGVDVSLWQHDGGGEKLKKMRTGKTSADGMVSFDVKMQSGAVLFAAHNGQAAISDTLYVSNGSDPFGGRDDKKSTFFFTDRSLYRPGQLIQFKGIHVFHDTGKNDYRVLPNAKRRVVLKDVNGREVASLDATTNAFGSISGSVTAPQHGLMGRFILSDDSGSAVVNVEEYKRPRFHVDVDKPAAAPKLGEEVTVKVKALAYTGAAVDGAIVRWTVRRESRWPAWTDSWRTHVVLPPHEIARGESKTGADGTVEIKFVAVPDKKEPEKFEPWFQFDVHANITDTAGETRSGSRSVSVGSAALKAEVTLNDWQTVAAPVEFTVWTTSLDNESQPAEGTLVVHRLVPPEKVHRVSLEEDLDWVDESDNFQPLQPDAPPKDLSKIESWESGEVVQRDTVKTDAEGKAKVSVKLTAGAYRAVLETKDRFGKKVTAQTTLVVIDPASDKFPVRMPFWLGTPSLELQPGGEFTGTWGTGYAAARAFIEIEHRGKILQRFWTDAARTQQSVTLKIAEEHRGGITVHVSQMRENRLSTASHIVEVPWTNKDLELKWEHITSKLEPGAKETWTLSVSGPGKEKAAAEMAGVLYDASLDAFTAHEWSPGFYCFYRETAGGGAEYAAMESFDTLEELFNEWNPGEEESNESPRTWPWVDHPGLAEKRTGISSRVVGAAALGGAGLKRAKFTGGFDPPQIPQSFSVESASFPVTPTTPPPPAVEERFFAGKTEKDGDPKNAAGPAPPDLSKISARQNFQETAFFLPQLITEDDGTVKMSFTMPDAVTSWKFLGFAHDKALRSGFIAAETVTARDLMVQPNPPRFLREGDSVEFTVKITNQSESPQQGSARLHLADAVSLASADAAVGNQTPDQSFTLPPKESRTVSWRITVPDGQGFLTWKAVAGTDKLTDGEEGWLPVLSRRIPVTESMPLPIRDAGEKEFAFKKLMESAASNSLRHQSLTVQMVSQPAWYAVMALPYLMEFPHECTEQTFNRLYANALAAHIANSDPKIRRVFNLWRDVQPEAIKSPLEKNAALTSMMIEETPWLREAQREAQQRNMGALFDQNRLDSEIARLLGRMNQLQMEDGAWSWFPGGRANDFITLYIVSGFGRLKHLGVQVDVAPALRALDRLDAWIARSYRDIIKRGTKDADNLTSTAALYLYGRSFFLQQRPVSKDNREAVDYFLGQAREHWTSVSRMSQAHAALGLLRFGDNKTPSEILASIKERSVGNEELGLHWAEKGDLWSWNQAPIESQALMIEAFRDIAKDEKSVDDCQVWLLKQKQTEAWPTTKATADAIYSLLLGGTKKLSSDALVTVSLGGAEVKPEKVEAGTGFFERKFTPAEIKAEMGTVKLTKKDKGVAWGSLHWQYMEDMSKITPHEGTPLKVTKSLFIRENTKAGPELKPVTGKVKVGDELVVRIEIRTDRDMEFVHLKDQRPSSVEPVNVLSGYKWQDGLGYYESTRDTASHFFMDSLPKGTYVFEYSSRVQLRGKCQTGIAELQCMYAPEFNSHSASTALEVE